MRVFAVVLLAGCGRISFDPVTVDDARTGDAAIGTDARTTSGAWSFVSTQPGVPNTSTGQPITSTDTVSPGDLVIPICRGLTSPMPSTIQLTVSPASAVVLAPIIQHYDPVSQYWHAFAWGVVDSSVAPGTGVSFTTDTLQGNADCLITVFRGVTSSGGAPTLVDQNTTTGGAGGMMSCGPINTVANGLAIYSAARTTCADAPISGPFVQLGTAYGNPFGAFAPSNGTSASATLTDCGNSGGWICTTLSLTP
jgi:hypothetical protein